MKIIQIGPFPLNINYPNGGVEASVYGLSNELAKTNQLFVFDIPRICFKEDRIEKEGNLNVFRFYSKGSNNIFSIFRIKEIVKIIRQEKPAICHIHTLSLFPFLIYLFLKLYNIPVIVTIHGLAYIEKRNLWLNKRSFRNLLKFVFQSLTEFIFLSISDVLIVDTQYVADTIRTYKKQWKIFRLPVCKVIPQGVSIDFFQLETVPQKYVLLSVGAFSKRKGHLNLIDAMVKIRTHFPDFSLMIAGALTEENYYHMMQNKISEYGFENNIRLFPNVSNREIMNFFRKSEIFVLHSEEESQGIVLCEAMAVGLPVVATNVGGIPWVIENKTNGFLSDFGDIESFSDNLTMLMKNDNLRKRIRENNKKASMSYNWKHISEKVTEIYKSII